MHSIDDISTLLSFSWWKKQTGLRWIFFRMIRQVHSDYIGDNGVDEKKSCMSVI